MSLFASRRRYIRIAAVPPGEAPLWVREKWVGLDLPLAAGEQGMGAVPVSGVLSGPGDALRAMFRSLRGQFQRELGYAVDVIEAVNILERTAPDAATWWRQNVPRLFTGGRRFLFPPTICELLPERTP